MVTPQLSKYFIRKFNSFKNTNTVVLAPEGLHRFYLQGFSGRVVASWMTKEDRHSDIEDNHNFLNQVIESYSLEKYNIHILGFSQGVATAMRWISSNGFPIKKLVIWAGSIPHDLNEQSFLDRSDQITEIIMIRGNQDDIYPKAQLEKDYTALSELIANIKIDEFKGSHSITQEGLNACFPTSPST